MHVITGPRNLTDKATWPDLDPFVVPPIVAPRAVPEAGTPVPLAPAPAPTNHNSSSSFGFNLWLVFFSLAMCLGACNQFIALILQRLYELCRSGGGEREDSDIEAAGGFAKHLSPGAE
mmetsp:Transcript_95226/g.266656  ORF Transcript_95226/g.266656 Transcript_95226/m.266656 type:complete len:118 (-) Transcript_95226:138-491(-)